MLPCGFISRKSAWLTPIRYVERTAMTNRPVQRALLIDADDTLWENNIFYLQCTERYHALMGTYGFSPEHTQAVVDHCERELIPSLGYGPRCYTAALGLASERLMGELGLEAPPDLVAQARECAALVNDPPMILLPRVRETLEALRPSSLLVLVTKGPQDVQGAKLMRSSLAPLFDAVYIVPEKGPETYHQVVEELALEREHTWMVGNSPKSDINPALRAGLGALLVPHDHTWTAEHAELESPEQVVVLEAFADLPGYFGVR
jgi:putative hydrolase of the HAD superfamily